MKIATNAKVEIFNFKTLAQFKLHHFEATVNNGNFRIDPCFVGNRMNGYTGGNVYVLA
ncbi:hypothetical protein KRR40_32415 [Niabella defluvii]|nr:hypothetical protein KRR40_32415 [Niabella sp. I65]